MALARNDAPPFLHGKRYGFANDAKVAELLSDAGSPRT